MKQDFSHRAASRILRKSAAAKQRFLTTDYVLDETVTLLKFRDHGHLIRAVFDTILSSNACRIEWTSLERFESTFAYFLKHLDHQWSFTDCLSFQVMKELQVQRALTKDAHFREAGFTVLLRK